jgi:hypothetical protein
LKKLILFIFIVFVIAGDIHMTFAWDSTAAKYLPLQVGNTWVYRGTARGGFMEGRSYQTYKITHVLDTLGERYYSLQVRVVMISGTLQSGVWQLSTPVRIDSVSMKVYKFQSYCMNNEMPTDSLNGRLYDTIRTCPSIPYANSVCTDTSLYNIFGNNYPSKKFIEFQGPGYSTIYVKGIGIVYSSYGYSMNNSQDSLRGCVINGVLYGDTSTLVGIKQISSQVPNDFSLSQNYPNPFNPTTHFEFQIADFGLVRLTVYDLLGKEIQTLVNEQFSPGTYEVDFDGSSLPSGVYYYKLETDSFTETKKMVLIK